MEKTLKDLKPPKVQSDTMHSAHEWMMFEFYYTQAIKDVKTLLQEYKKEYAGYGPGYGEVVQFIDEVLGEEAV